jgi:hypothetical protein
MMKRPDCRSSSASEEEEALPVALRWALVALFVFFSIVNLDWKHVATATFPLVQLHPIHIRDFLGDSLGTGEVVGSLEIFTAGFLSCRWSRTNGYVRASTQALSLITFVVVVVILSSHFQLDFDVLGTTAAPHDMGSGFFIKDLLLTAFTLSVLAIADLRN